MASAADHLELERAIYRLLREGLAVQPVGGESDRIAITDAGMAEVERWLSRIVVLFAGWPPDNPDVDDLTR